MNANPTDPTDAEMAHAEEFGSRNDAPDNVGPTEDDMPVEPPEENRGKSVWVEAEDGSVGRRQPGWEDAPEPTDPTDPTDPTEPAKAATPKPATRKPRTPTKSGDPRADRAAAKKAAAPKPVTKKATTAPKAAKDEPWTKLSTFKEPLTHSQAHVAYRRARTALHGAGPEAYRKAAAKALGITDAAFLIAFYPPKPEGK
jgi:hypothetical protein